MVYLFLYLDKIWSFLMFFLSVIFYFRRSSAFYGLRAVSHPSLDSRLPVIPLWTPGYQSSVEDSRLPVILPSGLPVTNHLSGLQTTSPLWTLGYQPSGDFRLPALYEFKVSCWMFSTSFRLALFYHSLCLNCGNFILSIFLPYLWLSLAQLSPSLSVFHLGCLWYNFWWYCVWNGSTVPSC